MSYRTKLAKPIDLVHAHMVFVYIEFCITDSS